MILAGKTERAEHLVCGRRGNARRLACTRLGDCDAPEELRAGCRGNRRRYRNLGCRHLANGDGKLMLDRLKLPDWIAELDSLARISNRDVEAACIAALS